MAITRVESLIYGVTDIDSGIRYFENWGLENIEKNIYGAIFKTPTNQTVHIQSKKDPSLPPAPDDENSTVRQTIWGVETPADLEKIGAEMSIDREVKYNPNGSIQVTDECGFSIGFCISKAKKLKALPPRVNLNENSERLNAVVESLPQAKPLRLGHVVYYIPSDKADQAVSFYIDRLGFRLSDRTLGRGDFMRCPGSRDHHNLFLLRRKDKAAFNHAAFEVQNFDEIMMGGVFMKSNGWQPDTTPGRHILGSNLYWYFRNPSGGNTEYFADMDCMDDDWKPRIWDQNPGFSLWSLSDPV